MRKILTAQNLGKRPPLDTSRSGLEIRPPKRLTLLGRGEGRENWGDTPMALWFGVEKRAVLRSYHVLPGSVLETVDRGGDAALAGN